MILPFQVHKTVMELIELMCIQEMITSSEDKDINSSESEESHGFNENDLCDSDSTMSGACQRILEYNGMRKKRKMQ